MLFWYFLNLSRFELKNTYSTINTHVRPTLTFNSSTIIFALSPQIFPLLPKQIQVWTRSLHTYEPIVFVFIVLAFQVYLWINIKQNSLYLLLFVPISFLRYFQNIVSYYNRPQLYSHIHSISSHYYISII